jgi:predicted aspartyl protease
MQRRSGVLATTTPPSKKIHYTINVDTANVRNQTAAVPFEGIAVGSIVERQLSALRQGGYPLTSAVTG